MHWADRLELEATIEELRRELRTLLAEAAATEHYLARLRRIVFLLIYMAEHLEMMGGPRAAASRLIPGRQRSTDILEVP